MKSATVVSQANPDVHTHAAKLSGSPEVRKPLSTRFGDIVDVRNRGVLRLGRLVGIQVPQREAPAVVRIWSGEQCRELSSHQARILAAQLLEAANYAERQNSH